MEKFVIISLNNNLIVSNKIKDTFSKYEEKNAYGIKFQVELVHNSSEYQNLINRVWNVDILLMGLNIDDDTTKGFSIIKETRTKYKNLAIIVHSSLDKGENIIKTLYAGADEFIAKDDADNQEYSEEFCRRLIKTYILAQIKYERPLHSVIAQKYRDYLGIEIPTKKANKEKYVKVAPIGHFMESIKRKIPFLMNSAVRSVYIEGRSGTGKTTIAEMFKEHNSTFEIIHCGAIASTISASEFFGHERGAYTSAYTKYEGAFQRADGGWIFLDDISCLTADMQSMLLDVLSTGRIRPMGGNELNLNVKVIAASNQPIKNLVKERKFRKDLWSRIRGNKIKVPDLKFRKEEIPALVENFCKNFNGGPYNLKNSALMVLQTLNWEIGNIRDLENCLRDMTIYSINKCLTPLGIPRHLIEEYEKKKIKNINTETENLQKDFLSAQKFSIDLNKNLKQLEKDIFLEKIKLIIRKSKGKTISIRNLSKNIGISAVKVEFYLKKYIETGDLNKEEISKYFPNFWEKTFGKN